MNRKSARFLLGKRVRKLRISKGWTQPVLAKRVGISVSYLQKIEGKNPPNITADTMIKISKSFKIKLSELLSF